MTLVSTYVANEDRVAAALSEAGDETLAGLEIQQDFIVLAEPLARHRGQDAQYEDGKHLDLDLNSRS